MDEKTRKYVHQRPPQGLVKKLFKKKKSMGDIEERLVAARNDRALKLTVAQKEKLDRVIAANRESGVFDKEKVVVDENGAKAMEKYHEERIKRGIALGAIQPPDPKELTAFKKRIGVGRS